MRTCLYGDGDTTVVLAAGAGQTSQTWSTLVPRLSASMRVVTFDRAGLGGSDSGPVPRTPNRIANELFQALEQLHVSGKLVMVGHSMGGIHMLSFAEQHPDRVAAVVLLDTPPKGFETMRLELLNESEREARRALLASGLTNMPEVVRLEREGAASEAAWNFDAYDRRIPLFVLAADSQEFGPHGSQSAHRDLWIAESKHWLSLSDFSAFAIAKGSGHMIHHDRPQLVVNTIERAASLDYRN